MGSNANIYREKIKASIFGWDLQILISNFGQLRCLELKVVNLDGLSPLHGGYGHHMKMERHTLPMVIEVCSFARRKNKNVKA